MADREYAPWLYGSGWRFGPFTFTDEAARKAEETWAQIQAEQDANSRRFPDDPRLDLPVGPGGSGPNLFGGAPSPFIPDPDNIQLPEITVTPEDGGESFTEWYTRNNRPPDLPDTAPIPQSREALAEPEASPEANPEVVATPPQDDIGSLKTALRAFFPDINREPSQQQMAADAEMERQRKRTGLLAQIALFSGITSAAGGPWGDVGKGLAAAGEVYDQGFNRYHQTLQANADREMKMRNEDYDRDVSLTNAAIKLYTSKSSPKNNDADKRRKERLDYFKETKPGLEETAGDPEVLADWQRRYEHFLQTGEFLPKGIDDVSD